ncbi:MAG: flagellar biosynthesis protein FlhB [Ignavibacteriae bacterium]|nr:flagellar biosynthesis protein FlhB [Ignavibacteriota bacterium]MCB9206108.1 flagellar biosynthesis protein FlhB [Ignavibacteriales bacterium]MCB9209381.1 flagellar biosynthesis protein FlhB [Ignavibacteriales bacterium]MCB9258024.1 flagellar biosynthesis protein FlhB [Ignavibacteriales bacterium]
MAERDGQEKTEQATGKKLEDSRNEGKVARSQELNSLAVFTTGLLVLFFTKDYLGSKLWSMSTYIFSSLDTLELSVNVLSLYGMKAAMFFVAAVFPVLLAIVIISFAVGYGQVGFRFTPKALQPKLNKLNPITGFKNSFLTTRPLVELLKSVAKLGVVGIFSYIILEDMVLSSIGLVNFTVTEIVDYMLDNSIEFLWRVSLVYVAIAFIDFAYQKYKFKDDLKMTKQEVKEEHKQTEGDPHVKSQIKSKQFEMARKRMLQDVPKADVVITNPTHFAVALKYEVGKSFAPKVIAKGQDLLAQKIKQIAKDNNVPLHEDVQLARALYKACEVGQEIPENLFKAVAQILAYIFKLKEERKRKKII